MIKQLQFLKDTRIQTIVSSVFLFSITMLLSFYIVFNANWLFGDDTLYLCTTAIGKILPISNDMNFGGRFFPLGHYDFNILVLIGKYSPTAHYILSAISFILFVIITSFFYKKIINNTSQNNKYNIFLLTFCVIFLIARFFPVFIDIIFPERIVIVLLSLFMFLNLKINETNRWRYILLSIMIAIYAVYCKEPIFGVFLVFSFTQVVFNYKDLTRKQRIYHIVLIINSFVFIVLYYFLVFRHTSSLYTVGNKQLEFVDLIKKVCRDHKVLVLAFVLALFRAYKIIFKKEKEFIIYDAFLFSGIAYSIAMLIFRLDYSYYYFPSIALCLPALIFMSVKYIHVGWVTIIVLMSAILCSVKVINYIKENQVARITTYPSILQIGELKNKGYQLIWYQKKIISSDCVEIMSRDTKKSYLEGYLKYILKDSNSLVLINSNVIANKRMIVFYLEDNNVNKEEQKKFQEIVKQNKLLMLNNIAGIKVYEKN